MQPSWQSVLFSSPRNLKNFSTQSSRAFCLEDISYLILSSKWLKAESMLLSHIESDPKSVYSLLAFLDLRTRNFARLSRLIPKLIDQYHHDPFIRALSLFWGLLTDEPVLSSGLPNDSFWSGEEDCTYLCLAHANLLMHNGLYQKCQSLINNLLKESTLERDILQANLFIRQREPRKALDLLLPWRADAFGNQTFWRVFLQAHFTLEEGKNLQIYLDQAIQEIPLKEELFDLYAWGLLLNRKPALGRQVLLKQRLMGWNLLDPKSIAHLYNSHEMLGETSNLIHIHPLVDSNPLKYLDIFSNLIVHLTSLEHSFIENTNKRLMEAVQCTPGFSKHKPKYFSNFKRKNNSQSLNIVWVTGDSRYHPVSRFILTILSQSPLNSKHHHSLISTRHAEDHMPDFFKEINGLQYHDFSVHKAHYLTESIRELKPDIAIDLSGWTDGHSAASFMARVAPVQVNYLGYFGTTGIPSMDWWLGDSNLFPSTMKQWHSENIFRLPRCFIAWSPNEFLPEGQAQIDSAQPGGPRFGCFNHLRKLSDLTLKTWASILASIPDSRLILKAPGFEDPMTIELLRRRILRAGLNLESIDFLPFSKLVSEHLSQYRFVDIALDPFPNGGCTTTAEALWMGVPVITLKGNSYVSRMSTAVLRGANLNSLVANNLNDYCNLAIKYASNLKDLRNSRNHWRDKIINSPLGDANSLKIALEGSFMQMYDQI